MREFEWISTSRNFIFTWDATNAMSEKSMVTLTAKRGGRMKITRPDVRKFNLYGFSWWKATGLMVSFITVYARRKHLRSLLFLSAYYCPEPGESIHFFATLQRKIKTSSVTFLLVLFLFGLQLRLENSSKRIIQFHHGFIIHVLIATASLQRTIIILVWTRNQKQSATCLTPEKNVSTHSDTSLFKVWNEEVWLN